VREKKKKFYPQIQGVTVCPKNQRLRKMSDDKIEASKAEVHRLLEAKFI
jgi:hypothetical protein